MRRLLVLSALVFAVPAHAVVTIDWVPVGSPGNAPDTASYCMGPNCGSVADPYLISKYEVTNAQYAEFLNAKAASDPLALYNTNMGSNEQGGITRTGSSGSYVYAVKPGFADKPANFVSFYDSLRFANWLNNGQGAGSTETGAYTLLGGTATPSNGLTVTRNLGANIFLPSENEWYKAAYYDGLSATYFDYPAGTNTATVCAAPTGTANRANCSSGGVTNVGAYTGSASPYGTFDQGGNVWEWNEQIVSGSGRGIRGGGSSSGDNNLPVWSRFGVDPHYENDDVGFRVASRVPALVPATFVPLGDLPGDSYESYARAVSDDGSTVVGSSYAGSPFIEQAFRWTFAEGMIGLPPLPDDVGGIFAAAYDVSADGSVVIGRSSSGGSLGGFLWTMANGMTSLGAFYPYALSADGSVLAGNSSNVPEALRWTSSEGFVGLGVDGSPAGVSEEGSVIVGTTSSLEPFHWTREEGATILGPIPWASEIAGATGVSNDGSVVVGFTYDGSIDQYFAFRWTSNSGMQLLELTPRVGLWEDRVPTSVSGNGSLIVGHKGYDFLPGVGNQKAFIWDETNGVRELEQVLRELGASLDGWSLREASDISADGRFVVGHGINPNGFPEAYLARLGECGDGYLFPDTCDDANTASGDGCSDICEVELGFECNGEPSVCISLLPSIDVTPRQYDFGQVDIGQNALQIATISNSGQATLTVSDLDLMPGTGTGFTFDVQAVLPIEIEPGASADVGLHFTPVTGGAANAILQITSDDPDEPLIEVPLTGTGVPYDAQAMALLDFFDDAVVAGDLVGNGPGNSAVGRLHALRNMIEASGDLLEQGRTKFACAQLEVARRRTDGLFPPPDFVDGPAAPDLEAEIAQLRSNLGCNQPRPKCGLGAELALALPLLAWTRRRRRTPAVA